jgi:hypothetical protein
LPIGIGSVIILNVPITTWFIRPRTSVISGNNYLDFRIAELQCFRFIGREDSKCCGK